VFRIHRPGQLAITGGIVVSSSTDDTHPAVGATLTVFNSIIGVMM
jgi:hypothetical protein